MFFGLERAGVFLSEYGGVVALGALATAGVVSALYYLRPRTPASGEADMGKVTKAEYVTSSRLRRIRENEKVEEMFLDGLLSLLVKGELSEQGYENWLHRFAHGCDAPDFLRHQSFIPPTQEQLKAILKKRRNGGSYHGIYKTPNIPGGKPGERMMNDLEKLLASKLNHQ
jgi:hypothetical protein